MSMNKKILAVAIVSGLFATSANAAVNISSTTPGTVTIASELVPSSTAVITNAANALDIQTSLKYAFSNGEVRYARIECDNVKFAANSAASYVDDGTAVVGTANLGAVNGLTTNAISFSVTAASAGVGDETTDMFSISGDRILSGTGNTTCTYGLYDQPSQAAAGGTTGRIATASGTYLNTASGYAFGSTPGALNTADVEATPAFSRFVTIAGQTTVTTARLAQLVYDVAANTQLDYDGADITLADMMGATTNIRVQATTGDFSAAASTGAVYDTNAQARVFLAQTATCGGTQTASSTLSSNVATFTVGSTANVNQYLCMTVNGTNVIEASTFEATLDAVASGATYNPIDKGPFAAGAIVRNGTELQAPLVQLPGNGWLSRMVLTNTGTVARPYTIKVLRESGSAGTTGTLTGTVPAGTLVVDLSSVLPTFTAGLPRATLTVTVAGPDKQIQGLYQIVNANSLTISNHVMVRPGTN